MMTGELTWEAVGLRILCALVFGGLLGMERGMKNRAAGMRTYMLVCVGACLVMLTNQYIFETYHTGDPVRMGAQVVSGIGFLGAGTIIVTRHSQIKGLTTAAGLWTTAVVGMALGIGFYGAAIMGGVAVFVAMTLMQRMDDAMRRKTRFMEIYFELTAQQPLGVFLRQTRELGIEIGGIQRESEADSDTGIHAYIATLKTEKRRKRQEMLSQIRTLAGVEYLEEL